ncbi:MAG: hypothetical protein PHI42_06325 [Paludibacteraceae bacterium]|nr:hypothetical protein [Paludibacteraceae bacterium]
MKTIFIAFLKVVPAIIFFIIAMALYPVTWLYDKLLTLGLKITLSALNQISKSHGININ